jgi:lipopolysaccharide export system permease protein
MRILRTYLLKEHVWPFVVTLCGLTLVLLLGNLMKFAELVVAKGVSVFDLLRLLIYLTPYLFSFTIPMACLIAMVLSFGRLNADYEIIAMRASGIAPARLVAPMVVLSLVLSLLVLVLNDRIVPASHLAFRRQIKAIGVKQPTAYLEAGTFIKDFPPYIIFVYQVRGKTLHDVRIYEPQANGPTRTIIATRGEFERLPGKSGVVLKLTSGSADEWSTENPGAFYKVAFSTYAINLRSDQDDPERVGKKLKEMTFTELVEQRRMLAVQDIETLPVTLELHRKIASAFAPAVFILFGLALGLQLGHQERLMTYVWVLAIFMGYYLSSVGMNAVALKGWLDAAAAMWIPNVFGATVASVLIAGSVRS